MTLVNVLFYLSRQSLFIRTNRQRADHGGTFLQLTNPFMTKQLQLCMLCSNLQSGHSNRDTWKKFLQSQRFLKTRFSSFFLAYGPCNNIHQFEGCFLIGQLSLNGFKNFNGCIVEYLNFISLSAKTLENLLFWENVVIGQFSSKCPVWLSALQCTSLVLIVFLSTVMFLIWFSVYRLLAAASSD